MKKEMKIILLADGFVGSEITKFLIKNYYEDIAAIFCTEKNDIYKLANQSKLSCKIFEDEKILKKQLEKIEFDIGILAWWPNILSNNIISLANTGFINTHNSYLPNNRGKHPYFWAIVEEIDYGVTIHWVDEGIDSGDIIKQKKIKYTWEDNSETIYLKSLKELIKLFSETYPLMKNKNIKSFPQKKNGSQHYSSELDKFSQIDLEKDYKARDLLNIIRARTTSSDKFKAAFFKDGNDIFRVKISIKKE
jgi:methionyl-tRNA formyltransferase